jgi:prepilin-type N-terminal cleavage/methylation domain-containing protein
MLTSDKGFTIVELLVAMMIVGFVMAGVYELVVSSSKFYLAQNAIVAMQADGRAAMDFISRELRSSSGGPVVSKTYEDDDTISFDRVEETGYSSGGNSSTTLNDTGKIWQAGMFAFSASAPYTVTIVAGTGLGQSRIIQQNTATQLTLSPAWGVTPDSTSYYIVTINKGFTRTSSTDNILRYRIGNGGDNNPLAENIVSHSFKVDGNIIDITLTARTLNIDPTTKQYREYKLTEKVRRRN